MENNEISKARQARGQIAWKNLEQFGGFWPLPDTESDPRCAPSTFWEAMGEYKFDDVQAIIVDAFPRASPERSWPWVARAIFNYRLRRSMAGMVEGYHTDAAHIAALISKHALGLYDALVALNTTGFKSRHAIGSDNWDKADDLRYAINNIATISLPERASLDVILSLQSNLKKYQNCQINFIILCRQAGVEE